MLLVEEEFLEAARLAPFGSGQPWFFYR